MATPGHDAVGSLVRAADTAMIVVTTQANDQRAGCLVGFHTQCSIDPVRYAVWLSKANHTHRVAMFATHLAVHVLDASDRPLADLFGGTTGDEVDKFAQCEWQAGPGDVPLLTACPNRMVLERTTVWDDGSDHVCFVGTPVDASATNGLTPLRITELDDLDAGHGAHDRDQPDELSATTKRREDIAAGACHPVDLVSDDQPPGK